MTRTAAALLTLLAVPSIALAQVQAQTQGAPTKDKEAVTFNEIERGFFVGLHGGFMGVVNPPAAAGTPRPFAPGQMAQVQVGYELGERLSVSGFLMGSANRAGSQYVGHSGGAASGDFSTLIPGGAVQFNLVGFSDNQDVKRLWLYARGGGGLAMFSPSALLPTSDVFLFVGPGVEYFTRLRHFSVGLELTGSYLVGSGTLGFALTPNLRYSF
jgi:hypothetical protein